MAGNGERRFMDWLRMLGPVAVFLVSLYVGYRILETRVSRLEEENKQLKGEVAEVRTQTAQRDSAVGERLASIEAKIDILLKDRERVR